MSPSEYLEWIKNNKHLKTVASHHDTFSLTDVAMRAGGADTAVYLKHPELQLRMRRGLTFLHSGDHLEVARQGLPKFFDLELEEQEKEIKDFQFPITLYNLEKLNGENAQISYSKFIGKWIICSKNVAIAVESLQEAEEKYSKEQRFSFALYIARHWFNGCVPQIKHIDDLKQFLDSNTLVGEVCDVSQNQHIVDNPQRQGFIAFAIVTKAPSGPGTPLCTMPNEAVPIFEKFAIPHVDAGESCVVSSRAEFPKLETFVEKLTVDASPDPYVCLSEGSVVYAVDRNGKVLFLAKVKTNKYRILRRVRELMKNLATPKANDPSSAMKSRTRFRADLKKWGFHDSASIDAYMLLYDACDHVRKTHQKGKEDVGRWFIDFLHSAISEIKAGRVRLTAPTVDVPEEEEPAANGPSDKAKVQRKRRNRGRRGKKALEPESSEGEDKEFAALPGDVNVKTFN